MGFGILCLKHDSAQGSELNEAVSTHEISSCQICPHISQLFWNHHVSSSGKPVLWLSIFQAKTFEYIVSYSTKLSSLGSWTGRNTSRSCIGIPGPPPVAQCLWMFICFICCVECCDLLHINLIRVALTKEHSHCSRGCRNNNEEPGCSMTKVAFSAKTRRQIKAVLLAITLASATHFNSTFPRGSRKDRSVVGIEMETHVEHLTPCQFTKPSSDPRKIETMWVLK